MIAESHTLNREGKHVYHGDAYLPYQVAEHRAVTRLREQTRDYNVIYLALDKGTGGAIKSAPS